MDDIEKRYLAIREVEPDAEDIEAIKRIEQADDISEGLTLDEMDRLREEQRYSGKISLRLPKSLHRSLANCAQEEGISLNQYILYKLAQNNPSRHHQSQ